MKTNSFIIKNSVLLLTLVCISNSAWAQIKVENSKSEDNDVHYVYYTDGSSNFDYMRLWHDYDDEEMQLDYCKAFIGQKILCIKPGNVRHATYQIKDIEGGEFLLDFNSNNRERTKLGSFTIHKMGTSKIGQPKITTISDNINNGNNYWSDNLRNKKEEVIGRVGCYTTIGTTGEEQKFFSQFLLIKGAYTIEEANQLIENSKEKLLYGKMYLPNIQKQINKLEKKKEGNLKPNELSKYKKLTDENKYYKILFNEKEYYADYLKGDTLISMMDHGLVSDSYNKVCLLVEDNQGKEYFITFSDGAGCITEKHFDHVREQYVSQFVAETHYDGRVIGPTMKCEDIVLRNNYLQAKLCDVQTGEITYVRLRYRESSCSISKLDYIPEEEGAYFYLDGYDIVVPENL